MSSVSGLSQTRLSQRGGPKSQQTRSLLNLTRKQLIEPKIVHLKILVLDIDKQKRFLPEGLLTADYVNFSAVKRRVYP